MKFNSKDIQILRNFASINQSIVFKPGNTLKTISVSKTIIAQAKLSEDIESLFAIYDLPKFLSAVSLFDDPDLILNESSVTIKAGKEKLSYTYSEPSLILAAPDKNLKLPTIDVEFELKNDVLVRVQKAIGIIGSPEIAFVGDGEKIYVTTANSKDKTDSSFRVEVGETDKTFKMIYLTDNIKILPGDYQVTISSKGISQFTGENVTYWIVIESNSEFNG